MFTLEFIPIVFFPDLFISFDNISYKNAGIKINKLTFYIIAFNISFNYINYYKEL